MRRHSPKVGAQCGNPARWDLCGGPPTRAVPTAPQDVRGMVRVCWVQQGWGCPGGVRISGRSRSKVMEEGRRGQRILPVTAGQVTRW